MDYADRARHLTDWFLVWPDDATLVLEMASHVTVAGFSEREDVWRALPQVSPLVQPHLNDTRMKHVAAVPDELNQKL